MEKKTGTFYGPALKENMFLKEKKKQFWHRLVRSHAECKSVRHKKEQGKESVSSPYSQRTDSKLHTSTTQNSIQQMEMERKGKETHFRVARACFNYVALHGSAEP